MTELIENLNVGTEIEYCGKVFTVLEKGKEGALCFLQKSFMLDSFFKKEEIDSVNNYKYSNLMLRCESDFVGDLVANGADMNDFIPFKVDLSATDGSNEYGYATAIAAPLTLEQYGKYKTYIPFDSDWWYTVTPESTPWERNRSVLMCSRVWIIGPHGSYSIGHCRNKYGVRPAIKLRNDTKVEVCENES